MFHSKRYFWPAALALIVFTMAMVEVTGQDDNGILGRARNPQWVPNFPGSDNFGSGGFGGRNDLEEENEIPFEDEEEEPFVETTTRRYPYPTTEDYTPRNEVPLSPTSTPAEVSTVTIPNHAPTEEKRPWYSRLGHFAKKTWHQLKNKFSG